MALRSTPHDLWVLCNPFGSKGKEKCLAVPFSLSPLTEGHWDREAHWALGNPHTFSHWVGLCKAPGIGNCNGWGLLYTLRFLCPSPKATGFVLLLCTATQRGTRVALHAQQRELHNTRDGASNSTNTGFPKGIAKRTTGKRVKENRDLLFLYAATRVMARKKRKTNIHIRVTGFEPTTFCSQNRHATKLRYTLIFLSVLQLF